MGKYSNRKMTKEGLQWFFENKVEPEIDEFIEEEVEVEFGNRDIFNVNVLSKVVKTPTLLETVEEESVFHMAKLYKFGKVKRRDPFEVFVECEYLSIKFFLNFKIKKAGAVE